MFTFGSLRINNRFPYIFPEDNLCISFELFHLETVLHEMPGPIFFDKYMCIIFILASREGNMKHAVTRDGMCQHIV